MGPEPRAIFRMGTDGPVDETLCCFKAFLQLDPVNALGLVPVRGDPRDQLFAGSAAALLDECEHDKPKFVALYGQGRLKRVLDKLEKHTLIPHGSDKGWVKRLFRIVSHTHIDRAQARSSPRLV